MSQTRRPIRPRLPVLLPRSDHPTEDEISPLALSILQLLEERPMHPYELASMMRDRHMDEFIRLNFGSLYHTVDVLEWSTGTVHDIEGLRRRHGKSPH